MGRTKFTRRMRLERRLAEVDALGRARAHRDAEQCFVHFVENQLACHSRCGNAVGPDVRTKPLVAAHHTRCWMGGPLQSCRATSP